MADDTQKKKRRNIIGKRKINFKINDAIFDLMIASFYSENEFININFFKKAKSFMDLIDTSNIEDIDQEIKITIIKHFLEQFLDNDINSIHLIEAVLETEIGSMYSDKVDEIISNIVEITEKEFQLLDKFVSHRLQYAHYYEFAPELQELALQISSNSVRDFERFNNLFEKQIVELQQRINKSKEVDLYTAWDLDTSDQESFHHKTEGIFKQLKSPSSNIVTGIKALNEMLGGGFKSGRFYLFLAASGVGKSGLLLNVVSWFKKFNQEMKPKDPTKIPVALYITVENDMNETLERFFALTSNSNKEIDEFEDANELIEEFKKSKVFDESENAVHVVLKYRPKNSLDCYGIRKMIDDLKAEGKEVCLCSVDYIKKLKANQPTGDLRLDLGSISDELSQIAKDYQIPVVSASQINRAGAEAIQKSENINKQVKSVGSSAVGESWAMIENSDVVVMCFKEIIENLSDASRYTAYLAFKREKMRGKLKSSKASFLHPFMENSDMKFQHDLYMTKGLSLDELPTNSVKPHKPNRGESVVPKKVNSSDLFKRESNEDEDEE